MRSIHYAFFLFIPTIALSSPVLAGEPNPHSNSLGNTIQTAVDAAQSMTKIVGSAGTAGSKIIQGAGEGGQQAAKEIFQAAGKAGSRGIYSSNEIQTLIVKQTNRVPGAINLNDNSQANVGNVNLKNTKLQSLTINTDNKIQSISANRYSTVNVGNVNVHNLKGKNATITTKNIITGKINANNNSHANIGNFSSQ